MANKSVRYYYELIVLTTKFSNLLVGFIVLILISLITHPLAVLMDNIIQLNTNLYKNDTYFIIIMMRLALAFSFHRIPCQICQTMRCLHFVPYPWKLTTNFTIISPFRRASPPAFPAQLPLQHGASQAHHRPLLHGAVQRAGAVLQTGPLGTGD